MSAILDRIKQDNEFAAELQKQAMKLENNTANQEDVDKLLEMIAETPEDLEALRALNASRPTPEASITITTITTLTTATTAF